MLQQLSQSTPQPPSPKKQSSAFGSTVPNVSGGPSSASTEQLQQQYKEALAKSLEWKDRVSKLEGENKKLYKVIQREVGEEVDIATLMDEKESKWKGRAQKISLLQGKVRVRQPHLFNSYICSENHQ